MSAIGVTRAFRWMPRSIRLPLGSLVGIVLFSAIVGAAICYAAVGSRWGVPRTVTGEATYISDQPIDISFRPDDWPPPGPEQGAPVMGLRLGSVEWVDRDGHIHSTGRPACLDPLQPARRVELTLLDVVPAEKGIRAGRGPF
jgi:hypothetical protein